MPKNHSLKKYFIKKYPIIVAKKYVTNYIVKDNKKFFNKKHIITLNVVCPGIKTKLYTIWPIKKNTIKPVKFLANKPSANPINFFKAFPNDFLTEGFLTIAIISITTTAMITQRMTLRVQLSSLTSEFLVGVYEE